MSNNYNVCFLIFLSKLLNSVMLFSEKDFIEKSEKKTTTIYIIYK